MFVENPAHLIRTWALWHEYRYAHIYAFALVYAATVALSRVAKP